MASCVGIRAVILAVVLAAGSVGCSSEGISPTPYVALIDDQLDGQQLALINLQDGSVRISELPKLFNSRLFWKQDTLLLAAGKARGYTVYDYLPVQNTIAVRERFFTRRQAELHYHAGSDRFVTVADEAQHDVGRWRPYAATQPDRRARFDEYNHPLSYGHLYFDDPLYPSSYEWEATPSGGYRYLRNAFTPGALLPGPQGIYWSGYATVGETGYEQGADGSSRSIGYRAGGTALFTFAWRDRIPELISVIDIPQDGPNLPQPPAFLLVDSTASFATDHGNFLRYNLREGTIDTLRTALMSIPDLRVADAQGRLWFWNGGYLPAQQDSLPVWHGVTRINAYDIATDSFFVDQRLPFNTIAGAFLDTNTLVLLAKPAMGDPDTSYDAPLHNLTVYQFDTDALQLTDSLDIRLNGFTEPRLDDFHAFHVTSSN